MRFLLLVLQEKYFKNFAFVFDKIQNIFVKYNRKIFENFKFFLLNHKLHTKNKDLCKIKDSY